MKGDFSKVSFNPRKHFRRVLMQQGRVLLDSDFNEQVSILLHDAQTIAEDLIGPHGGPEHRCGFKVSLVSDTNNFRIGTGHYYINGVLCRNNTEVFYTAQPGPRLERLQDRRYLAYLEAWEHHVTAEQDESLREEALGGADTTTRSKVAWRVRTIGYDEAESEEEETWLIDLLERLCHPQEEPKDRSRTAYDLLKERRIDPQKERARMAVPLPNAGYRGSENQLFRVEIHDGGVTGSKPPTFKWARDNASVVFPIVRLGGATAEMEHLGEDGGSPLQEDDWVEIVDRNTTYRKRRVPLLRVKEIDRVDFSVTLDVPDGVELPVYDEDSDERPLLRRWDSPGTVEIEDPQEGYEAHTEVPLGDEGLRVRLEAGRYYAGDYWTIPVRVGASDAVRRERGQEAWSRWMPPQGVSRHYAPLAVLSFVGGDPKVYDCRKRFEPLSVSPPEEEATTGYDHYEPRTLLGLFVDGIFHAVHDLLTIGRQEDNDITIPLDTVSRHQARVERSRDEVKLTVFDNVTNDNTYRNEEFVPRGRSVRLQPGDKIYLGDKEIEVVEKEVDEER